MYHNAAWQPIGLKLQFQKPKLAQLALLSGMLFTVTWYAVYRSANLMLYFFSLQDLHKNLVSIRFTDAYSSSF